MAMMNYEEWKASKGGRGGASGYDAYKSAQQPAPANPAPAPAPAAAAPNPAPAPAPAPGGAPTSFQDILARSKAAGLNMSEDYDRYGANSATGGKNTFEAWKQFYDPACPPNKPFRQDKSHIDQWFGGAGYDPNACVEKPMEQVGAPGGGGGGGYGGGGGGGYGGGGGEGGDLALYNLKNIYSSALADPTGKEAWKLFAGAGGASQYQSAMDAARKRIEGMPAGPARDAAMKDIEQFRVGAETSMPQEAYQNALQGLSGVVSPELSYVGSERDRALQRLLGMGNLNLQRTLGLGNLALQGELGRGQLALGQGQLGLAQGAQAFEQGTVFPWQQQEAVANRDLQRWLAEQQGKQSSRSGLWGTLGALGGAALSAAPFFSDIRVKENISPGRRGLSDVMKLATYNYNYKGDPDRRRRTGVMAQELEKIAPELVTEFNGIKAIDLYGLTSMTIEAIKELEERLSKGKN